MIGTTRLVLLFFIILSSRNFYASDYTNQALLGERNTKLYYGPLNPDIHTHRNTGRTQLKDHLFYENYLYQETSPQAFDIYQFWDKDLLSLQNCANPILAQNIQYFRYLFRLQNLSYLFESLKEVRIEQFRWGQKKNLCDISWRATFSKCRPRSTDMKNYVRRLKHRYLVDFNILDYFRYTPADMRSHFQKMNKRLKSYRDVNTLLDLYLFEDIISRKKNLSEKSILKSLDNRCVQIKKTMGLICNEEDELYGLSYLSLPLELLQQSHIKSVINQGGVGQQCLSRYSQIFSEKEQVSSLLAKIYPLVHFKLKASKGRYIQGTMFIPGSLREFEQKGLGDFIFAENKPKEAPTPLPLPTIAPKVVPTPKPAPTPKPKIIVKRKVVPPAPPKLSAFEIAYQKLVNLNLDRAAVDMIDFRDDLSITPKISQILKKPIQSFQTQVALKDMKKFDGLGSEKEPFRLFYIKYLIDLKQHHALWNIQTVLGEKFYMVNDIDKKKNAVYIELKNDEQTGNQWQITLINDKELKNKKTIKTKKNKIKKMGPKK